MKKHIYITAVIVLFTLTFTSCRMYSKSPKVSILTSKGILFNNEIFFIMHYKIFKQPKGIIKFPDGGLPKILIDEYYIVKYQQKYNGNPQGNKLICKIDSNYSHIDLQFVDISEYDGNLYFIIKYKNKEWKKLLYIINPKTGETIKKSKDYKIIKNNNEQNIISRKSTEEFVRFIYDYDKLGLKNPLDFMKLNDKNIKKVLLHDKLNGRMHTALIYYLIKNKKNKLLNEIEKENTDKYISGDIKYFKQGWTIEQLKEYYKSVK